MGVYTQLNSNEIQAILNLYNLGELSKYEALGHGISNSNFSVKTKEEHFLLKVSNDKDLSEISKEMDLLTTLAKHGFKQSLAPIPLSSGEKVYTYKEYVGVIFPFCEGVVPDIDHFSCKAIGAALAGLHSMPYSIFQKSIRGYTQVGFNAEMIGKYIEENSSCPKEFKEAFYEIYPEGIQHILGVTRQDSFPKALLHGDLYYDNTLFQNGKLVTLLDFEQAGVGNAILDMGISISGTCLEDNQISHDLIKAYLKGYESIRVLNKLERIFLKDAIIIGLFSISLWRIKRFVEKDLDPSKRESYKELIQRALIYKKSLS